MATSTGIPVITSFAHKPLTTTYTPPADCSGLYQTGGVYFVDLSLSCLPPSASTDATDFFSPGIACPSGYYSACHDTRGLSSITTVTCCPFRGDISLSCVDPGTLSEVWATLFCSWIAPSTTTLSITLSTNGGTTSTSGVQFISPAGLNAYGVRMVYESTDLLTSTTNKPAQTSAPLTISISNTAATTTTTAASQTQSTSPPSTKSTSATTIAIAVVIPVVALIVLIAAYMWWRKQRQGKMELVTVSEFYGKPPVDELPEYLELLDISQTYWSYGSSDRDEFS
ncbi:hypothetical protein OIDMADRAFT_149555 [Oidiodendron maius Zn]|uniref:Uncharacterized protein n=1 Tax=Oidiodendron maius (strain Zn) TaxID=913774 RepID=A0A0C3GDF8_OIDMZ|nr:hypothetical protein OIDMADRAFT_149555 [Oidiodendron maius Zn]